MAGPSLWQGRRADRAQQADLLIDEDRPVNRLDRAESLRLSGRPRDRELLDPRRRTQPEVRDRAAGREVAARLRRLDDDSAPRRKRGGHARADALGVVLSRGAREAHAEEVLPFAARPEEERLG